MGEGGPSPAYFDDEDMQWYVVRCWSCNHKIGYTDNKNETRDICARCERTVD